MNVSRPLRNLLQNTLNEAGLELRRVRPKGLSGAVDSQSKEQAVVQRQLDVLGRIRRYCVDIGAGDGEADSNSLFLFQQGWEGLSVECDPERFARMAYRYRQFQDVALSRSRATPDAVVSLLAGHEVPRLFGFLSLDIDGYDHEVLRAILNRFRPSLICAKINEKIPPPVRFSVRFDPDYRWSGDPFYGQSLCMLESLAREKGYRLIALDYNKVFLLPDEMAGPPAVPAADLYFKGYLSKTDRLDRLPGNREWEYLRELSPEDMVVELKRFFAPYTGRFICEV